ncbi:hypothetical protein [Bacillus vallismortis]|uniref:hypothetical protein n=1 Tax=Bacillus vallismortis TaxID=72361 RepID=UPI0013CE4EE6|nr:hypothetical protein [Bacillus vallismortis]
MATYVLLLKEFEDDETVVCKFGPNENTMSNIQLNKITRKFSKLEEIPDKDLASTFYFDRAAQRLAVCVSKRRGMNFQKNSF